MVRSAALLLTILTGFSGLVYEVAWQKAFAILLGSHSEATAAVLGIFLGGLSLGYALFGVVCRRSVEQARSAGRPPRLLLLYGGIECGIGVWALLFPWLFAAVQSLSLALSPESQGLAFAVDVVLTAIVIGPPTLLMGGTIPILTQALARSLDDATRFHALVYGFNTAGAFIGALAAGFVLIPALGIPETLRWMGGVNLLVGGFFAALGLRRRGVAPSGPAPETAPIAGFRLYALSALLLGFAMMSVQTVVIRVGGLAFGASHFTFAMVVAVFVLCIALGSLAVSAFDRIPRAAAAVCPLALAALLAALYPLLERAPYAAHLLRTVFRDHPTAFHPYYGAAFLGILVVLCVPIGLSGASLPLLFHALRREMGDLGRVAGRLYSWNTVGNLLGALLGGYALLFWLDLHHVYRIAVAAALGAGALLAVRILELPRARVTALALLGVIGLAALPAWDPALLNAGLFRYRQPIELAHSGPWAISERNRGVIRFHDDDPTTSVIAREHLFAGRKSMAIITNGKPDSSLAVDYPTTALVALLPCLIADTCTDAFVVGYGTGVTAGEFAALDSMQNVRVAEISRGVIEAAPLFDYGNLQASTRPEVHLVRSDAYRALLHSPGLYDVIASEPSNPWVSGVEMLYSREFLEAARDRLKPGGVYAQWFHTYETSRETIELVLRTYAAVFPNVAVWYTIGPDLLLLGFEGDAAGLEVARIARRMQARDFASGLRRAGIVSLAALLPHELLPVGVVHAAMGPGEIHTLMHPRLSHLAARAFFLGQDAELPPTAGLEPARVGARNSLLASWARWQDGGPSEADRLILANEACQNHASCSVFVARWLADAPDSPALAGLLELRDRSPAAARMLDPALLEVLASFFAKDPTTPGPALSAAAATQRTELYQRFYYHGVPFRREALADVWNRCQGSGCASARAAAERALGDLGPTVATPQP